jgi:hypothetical protein
MGTWEGRSVTDMIPTAIYESWRCFTVSYTEESDLQAEGVKGWVNVYTRVWGAGCKQT